MASHNEKITVIEMRPPSLEIRVIDKSLERPLKDFFRLIATAEDLKYFHPHSFTKEEVRRRSQYVGRDLYYVVTEDNRILGYGILRGWDEGYEVPSLGIIIHPSARGQGLAKMFMNFLHVTAFRKGAKQIRLKVYPENVTAVKLYKKLGYMFENGEEGQLVGLVDL